MIRVLQVRPQTTDTMTAIPLNCLMFNCHWSHPYTHDREAFRGRQAAPVMRINEAWWLYESIDTHIIIHIYIYNYMYLLHTHAHAHIINIYIYITHFLAHTHYYMDIVYIPILGSIMSWYIWLADSFVLTYLFYFASWDQNPPISGQGSGVLIRQA